jgi:hypothetical protein
MALLDTGRILAALQSDPLAAKRKFTIVIDKAGNLVWHQRQ